MIYCNYFITNCTSQKLNCGDQLQFKNYVKCLRLPKNAEQLTKRLGDIGGVLTNRDF